MKRTFIPLTPILAVLVLALGCSPLNPVNPSASSTPTPSPTPIVILDDIAARSADPAREVTATELDSSLMRGAVGKWVFCDYYTDSLEGIADSFTVGSTLTSNSWGAEVWGDGTPESGYSVSGSHKKSVRFIFCVDNTAPSFHVYEYLPFGSDYTGKNLWFGDEHVFYFDPASNGQIATGAPSLELFPDTATHTIIEFRIEDTSYFTYKGIHGGNFIATGANSDPGSTLAELSTAFGDPLSTVAVASMEAIDWNDNNKLYTFPVDGVAAWAYIHYVDPAHFINARFFLTTLSDGEYHITRMYLVNQ
jgi:hypothetical protein